MYRQYFRVFKIPRNLKINYYCSANKDIRQFRVYSSMCIQKQLNSRGRPMQVQSYFSSLVNSTSCSNNIDKKRFSQQIAKIEDVTSDKSDTTGIDQSISKQFDASPQDHSDASDSQTVNEADLFEDINYDAITDGDEENLQKFKLLMLEVDVLRQDGMFVPSKMSTDEWKELFALQSKSQRRKYLTFLFKNEMKKLSDKRKKELKRIAKLEQPEEESEKDTRDHLEYGFRGSTIMIRIYDATMNFFDNYRLIRAMMFGQDLIIDCGYFNEMNSMENKLCSKQLVYLFAENRLLKEPFNLHFCNLKKDSILFKHLSKSIPTIEDPAFPINIYDKHYLDLFPRQKLVYLTPHCREELTEFNPDDIYIVGALVDKVNTAPLSMAKAKSEGLRMARLPLERYLDWGLGNKSLTLNQMVKIMHDIQVTGDWNIAFQHIPRRKVRLPGEPVRDNRKPWKRGTTLQPPQRFNKYY